VVLSSISAKYSDIICVKSEVFCPLGLWYNASEGAKGTNFKKGGTIMAQQQGTTGNTYEFTTKDFIKSFIGVVKTVLAKPNDFYQNMPTTGGYAPPLIFLAVCLGISGIISALIWWNLAGFFYHLIFGLIFSFIGAGILLFVAQQFFEGKGSYEGTYRVVAYAGAVNLVTWITVLPVLGYIIAFLAALYGFYLQIVGVEKVHQITKGQAVVTVLIALAVYIIVALLIGVGGVFPSMR